MSAQDIDGKPLIFEAAAEGVERSFGKRISPELRARMAAMGIDFRKPLVGYPVALWNEVMMTLAAGLFPDLPQEERFRRMGKEFMEGFLQTGLGFAALTMGKIIGPRRTMERMGRNFRTAGNYLIATATVAAPTDVQIETRMEDQFLKDFSDPHSVMLHFRHGVLEGSLEALGVKRHTVEIVKWEPARQLALYRVRWEA